MKVTLEKEYKSRYTLEELEQAKTVIRAEKEDEETTKGWLEYAVNEALKNSYDCCERVIEAEAHTSKNGRAWDLYGESTGRMDIWIEGTAKTSRGYIEVGAYLSDIWQSGVVEYRQHMYIQEYTK